MKKAFNFKKLLVCVLILILCLSAFVACDKDKGQGEQPYDANGINMAATALRANVRGSKVSGDFTLDNHQMYAGVSYPISWTITANDGEETDVTLSVDGDKTTVHVNGKTKTEVKFTLTATLSDAKGVTATVEIKYTIPAYTLLTYAEYKAAKAGDSVTVQGTVSIISSKANGNKYNKLYMFDEDGGYYIYSTKKDPVTVGVELGMKIEITGTKSSYGNIEDAEIKIVDKTKTVEYEDITNEVFAANDMKDANLVKREYRFVTIKNVVIGDIDTENSYYKFTVGSNETYLRISSSECMLLGDAQTNFIETFTNNKGKVADVKGVVSIYSNAMYLVPVGTDALVVKEIPERTPAEQIEDAKTRVFTSTTIYGTGTVSKLMNADVLYPDVKIEWIASDTAKAVVAADNASVTYNFDTDATVTLTAKLTHTSDASLSDTKEFTINLVSAIPVTIAEFLAKEENNIVYSITGWIVAKQTEGNKKGSYVIADKTGAVFSYNGDASNTLELGSYVTVWGTRTSNSDIPQINTTKVTVATTTETYEPKVEKEFDMADLDLANAKASDYTGKYIKITGVTVSSGEKTDRLYLATEKGVYLHAFTLRSELKNVTEGQKVTVYGYCRGLKADAQSGFFQIQLVKIEAQELTDAEKVAYVKASLNDFATDKDFDLATSDVATITWTLKTGTGATLNGNHVTISQTDEDQTVVFTATIVSGEATDTKDITVTIKARDNRVAGVKGVVGNAYKLVLVHGNLNKTLYLSGAMDGYYFGTTENVDAAIDVYLEVVSAEDGTFRLYIQNGTDTATKKYIEVINAVGTDGQAHNNVQFNATATNGVVWKWNDNFKTYAITISDVEYVLGTRNDKSYSTISANDVSKKPFVAQLFGTPDPAPVKTNQELVDEAAEALKKDFTITAKSSGTTIELAATGINGATIVWTSSDNAVIAIDLVDGKYVATVNVPTTDGMTVTLTAVLTVGEGEEAKTANCEFPIKVTRTLADVEVSLGEITGGTVEVFVGDNKQTLPVTLKQENVITLNPVATDGYELVKVFVNGTELEKGTDGAYTYTLGTTKVEITATFRKINYVNVVIDENIENGSVTVKVGEDALDTTKQYRDGTVLTITATPAADYKLVEIKVNGTAITGTTYTIAENDTEVVITATFAEKYPAMSIADFKSSETTKGTQVKLTGVVTSVDKKAAYIQDVNGQAVYVFFGYDAPYSDTLKDIVIGKEYTFAGEKDEYYSLVQLKSPVIVGEARDPEYQVTSKEVDETAYNALTLANTGELLTLRNLVVANGKWMLGETEIKYYSGNANSANSSAVNARLAFLTEGVKFDLVGVNFSYNRNFQVAVDRAEVVVIDWQPVATIDLKEIGVNGTAQITVTANPAVTTDVKATFVTENDAIATVDENGVVTGVAPGTVAINVTANGHTVQVEVTVVAVAEEFAVNYEKTVEGANGSIASVMAGDKAVESGTKVVKGTTVTVTVTPDEGYQLASYTVNAGEAVAANGETSFDVTVTENVTIAVTFEVKPAEPVLVATFALGANGSASHADGTEKATYTETDGDYTLSIASGKKMYTGARDAKGNSCIKLGTGSAAATFTITAPTGVKKVIIYIAGYKNNTGAYTINGGAVAKTTTLSANGEYEAVGIDVPADGKIVIATTSAGYRAMINTIEFYA